MENPKDDRHILDGKDLAMLDQMKELGISMIDAPSQQVALTGIQLILDWQDKFEPKDTLIYLMQFLACVSGQELCFTSIEKD